jgi:hypothetical protein
MKKSKNDSLLNNLFDSSRNKPKIPSCWMVYCVNKNVKNIFLSMCDVKVSLTFTSLSFLLLLTTVLPVLFKYCYKYCYIDSRKLWAVLKGGGLALLKPDSSHHFFRNACTKSGSLRFSQFSGCWLILSLYILMSFDFPFVRLFGVR